MSSTKRRCSPWRSRRCKGERPHSVEDSRDRDRSYGPSFAIHGFMRYLGLRPAQLVAYALIYSCTVDKGCYDFGAAVLADWSGTSERTARTTIASLLEMGLVVERGSHVHGMNTVGRSLVAATEPIVRAREAWQADHPDAGRSSFRISPEISSREDSSSPAKVSR